MPFTIDEESLLIKGRKGDTASFTFNFNQDISDYTVTFYIQKSLNSSTAVIEKKYSNPKTNSITVNLTTTETELLNSVANSYGIYYWGLKLSDGESFAQTIIPQEFKNAPQMFVYPGIGGN